MKKGLILMALCLSFAAVASYSATVWSSAFDFDGTPTNQTVVIGASTPIAYSSYLRNEPFNSDAKSLTITATCQESPVYVADIYNNNYFMEITGAEVWNFKDSKYDSFPKEANDAYTLKEEIVDYDNVKTIYTRTITLAPEPTLLIALGLMGALLIRRRIKGVLAVLLLVTIGSFNAWAGGTITSVTCQQAWPLSRKVIITFSYTCDSTQGVCFYGTTDNGATTFNLSDRGSLYGGRTQTISSGSGSITFVWEPDSTLDSVVGKIKIGVDIPKTYMIVDLSDGSVSYSDSAPAGGFNVNEYKTTKMAFRYVVPGTFSNMGSPNGELGRYSDETKHTVKLTRGYYIGIFEVTEQQYGLITGSSYGTATLPRCGESYANIRGSRDGSDVTRYSILGELRYKTNLNFDLPTEAQWEAACRAGTSTALNSGNNLSNAQECPEMDAVGSYTGNGGPTTVGSFQANNWGLYDMHGNAAEYCLDWYDAYHGYEVDPKGPQSCPENSGKVIRGGSYLYDARDCRSAVRSHDAKPGRTNYQELGFRFVLVK